MAKNPAVNEAIREAFEQSGMSKREVARQLYGDPERWREFDRYLKTTTPRISVAVELARILGQPPTAFVSQTPLEAVATELGEAGRLTESIDRGLEALEAKVDQMIRQTNQGFSALARGIAQLDQRLSDEEPPKAQSDEDGP